MRIAVSRSLVDWNSLGPIFFGWPDDVGFFVASFRSLGSCFEGMDIQEQNNAY